MQQRENSRVALGTWSESFTIEMISDGCEVSRSGNYYQVEGSRSKTKWWKAPTCGALAPHTGISTLGCRVWLEEGGDEARSDAEHHLKLISDGLLKGFTLNLRCFSDSEQF